MLIFAKRITKCFRQILLEQLRADVGDRTDLDPRGCGGFDKGFESCLVAGFTSESFGAGDQCITVRGIPQSGPGIHKMVSSVPDGPDTAVALGPTANLDGECFPPVPVFHGHLASRPGDTAMNFPEADVPFGKRRERTIKRQLLRRVEIDLKRRTPRL
jgi:hypothetical protein